MKLFTVEEANELLPIAREVVRRIQQAHKRVMRDRDAAQRAAQAAASGGGGMAGGMNYVDALLQLAARTDELAQFGVQLKDYERGLIDFPSLREGRVVLLCWQMGEGDSIEWWHDTEAGFAGRQRL